MQQVMASRSAATEADFDVLVGPHLEAGYRTALAMLRDADEANDAVQEAALKAWAKLGQLHDRQFVRPWFLAIVANQCRSVRRSRWWSVIRMPELRASEPEVATTDATDVDRALARLPRNDRLALFLHFYLDLPFEEVGAVLGLSAAGAKTRVYRAAKKLRPDLEMS